MDLQIQPTLLGKAIIGQHVLIQVKGAKSYDFTWIPHEKYYNYVWRLSEQKPSMIEKFFPRLRATWETRWNPRWYKIYVDHEHPIAVNCPLYLRAVPEGLGFAHDENSSCLGAVAELSIL